MEAARAMAGNARACRVRRREEERQSRRSERERLRARWNQALRRRALAGAGASSQGVRPSNAETSRSMIARTPRLT